MPRSEAQRLQDMREACERIAGFLRGMDFDAFQADQRTMRAVLYDLVVLGEAAKGVSPETRERFPDIRWKAVAGMKDIATHQDHRDHARAGVGDSLGARAGVASFA